MKGPGSKFSFVGLFLSLGLFVFINRANSQNFKPLFSPKEWIDAFVYLENEGNTELLSKFETRFFESQSTNWILISKWIDSFLKKRNRSGLIAWFKKLSEKNSCLVEKIEKDICQKLKNVWVGNLDSIFFFESTAPKIKKLETAALEKNCSVGLTLVNEIKAQEGEMLKLMELSLSLGDCHRNPDELKMIEAKIREARIFF